MSEHLACRGFQGGAGPGERLSAWLDGELEPGEASAVASHVAGCPACAAEARALEAVSEVLGEVAPEPGPAAWAGFERGLDEELRREARLRSPWLWIPRGLVAAALVLLALGPSLFVLALGQAPVQAAGRLPSAHLPFDAPSGHPLAPTTPPTPLEELASTELLARAGLGHAARQVLARQGLVQLPSGARRLSELVPGPGAPLPPLATADASLLVTGAVLARAASSVEEALLRPGLLELLELLAREAELAGRAARDPVVRQGLLRLQQRAAVALLLQGRTQAASGLAPAARDPVEQEAALVRAGGGPRPSRLDPERTVDDRAFLPRGPWAEPALQDHARAVAWLGAWSPRLAAAHPDELREACLAALLLARGRLPAGDGGARTGLHLQAELEAALELLSGEPDGLGPLDLAAALGEVLGTWTPAPDALADPATLARLDEVLRLRARARGLPRVRGLGQGESEARFQLLGGTRSLEGRVLDRLGAVPARARPSALDLPALLGSRRARSVLAAAGLDAPGYDAALAALRPASEAFLRPGGALRARASLEQARTWSAAALLDRPDPSPWRPQSSSAWPDRALLGALGGLVPARAAPPVAPGPATPGPLPLVEPLPHLHARLAFGARRVAVALGELLPPGPLRSRSVAQLLRVAVVEEALRDASLDLLEGRPLRPGAVSGLRLWAVTVRELGPEDVRTAEDLYELGLPGGGVQVVHRAVVRLDRLVAVALDAHGRPALAQGPAVLACELLTSGERLARPEAIAAHPDARTPAWATHVVDE